MILTTLEQNEKAIITKVNGTGAFRKRIIEMGFVVGKEIKVIKKAPLKDPVEYEVMGYNVSLRRDEAELIEIEKNLHNHHNRDSNNINTIFVGRVVEKAVEDYTLDTNKIIKVAFVGNPNCGKTTIFNYASNSKERVANYAGATVESKHAKLKQDGYIFDITDLPGTYSITSYTPEEQFVREEIIENAPDFIVNVIDVSNLERNLYLTTQLLEMDIRVIVALNMYDELERNGEKLDVKMLEKLLGVPVIPTIGTKGTGIKELFSEMTKLKEGQKELRNIQINYGTSVETAINLLEKKINEANNKGPIENISSRFMAIKLIEKDVWARNIASELSTGNEIKQIADAEISRIEKDFREDSESLITDSKYGFISGALKETYMLGEKEKHRVTRLIDNILMHRVFSIPIFFFLMWLTFYSTFTLGAYPMEMIEGLMGLIASGVDSILADGILKDFLIDGIIGGVGGVIIFLPNIFILFFFISIMEDTGYMSRTVFMMDKLMHKIGLHGKSFIPLLMGFGCNVPAIMATRTIESKRDRLVTMLITPFMSCSARLPVYILFISAFFPSNQGIMLFTIYLIGIFIALLSAIVMNKTIFKKADMPFVMELPPYRMPTAKALAKHVWFKGSHYLQKMGTVILVASIIIWALGYFPREVDFTQDYNSKISSVESEFSSQIEQVGGEKSEAAKELVGRRDTEVLQYKIMKESERHGKSYIGQIGHFIEPVFRPLGFDWRMSVCVLTGAAAKEIVVSSMGVLYQADLEADETNNALVKKLQNQTYQEGPKAGEKVFNPLVAFVFILFILLYFPCIASLVAIKKESGGWKWMIFAVVYTTSVAWIVSFIVYQVGSLLI